MFSTEEDAACSYSFSSLCLYFIRFYPSRQKPHWAWAHQARRCVRRRKTYALLYQEEMTCVYVLHQYHLTCLNAKCQSEIQCVDFTNVRTCGGCVTDGEGLDCTTATDTFMHGCTRRGQCTGCRYAPVSFKDVRIKVAKLSYFVVSDNSGGKKAE